jgi:peptidoglycan/LPS O-acetylase OafA/YrhL
MGMGASGKAIYQGHIPELDGLRACGLAVVLTAHFWPQHKWLAISNALSMGWIAMDSFFVLSGFLIAGILLDSRHRPDYYRTYYVRRTLRIFPVYYSTIGVLILGMALWHGGAAYREFTRELASPLWFFAYCGNFLFAFAGRWAPVEAFSPLWSLQIEEQFYLLFPFLIRRLKLETLARILLGVVFFSPVARLVLYWWDPHNPYLQYVLLPCRAEGLALGALIAVRFRMGPWEIDKRRLTRLAFPLLAFALGAAALGGFTWRSPFNRTLGYFVSSVACGGLLLWLVRFRRSRATGWLRSAPFQYVGKISYGAYVLHVPVHQAVRAVFHTPDNLLMVPVYVALSIGAAAVSWQLLEGPLLNMKDRLAPPSGRASARAAIASAA